MSESSFWDISFRLTAASEQYIALTDAGAEVPVELENDLKQLIQLSSDKIDGLARYRKQCIAQADMLKAEADEMLKKSVQKLKQIDCLDKYILNTMKASGNDQLQGEVYKLRIKTSTATDIIDPLQIPKELMIEKVTTTCNPDKAAILKKLRAGEQVAGCALKTNERLEIK